MTIEAMLRPPAQPPDHLARFREATLDAPAEALAAALYGAAWREALAGYLTRRVPPERVAIQYQRWEASIRWLVYDETIAQATRRKTARSPFVGDLATFLADTLTGIVAHDGRSTRADRVSGWWLNGPDGWQPTTRHTIVKLIRDDVDTALTLAERACDRAVTLVRSERSSLDRWARKHKNERLPGDLLHRLHEANDILVADQLRRALISGLRVPFANEAGTVRRVLDILREELPLSDAALAEIASRWLLTARDLALLDLDRDALPVAEVRDAWSVVDGGLPLQQLYHGLDVLLGPRHRRIEWRASSSTPAHLPGA